MLARRLLVVPLLFCALSPSRLEAQRSPDAAVYGALVRYTGDESGEPQLLLDSTSTRYMSGSRSVPPRDARFWDAVPHDVWLRFDSLNLTARSLRGLALPATVQLLSRAEWRAQTERLARARVIDIGSVAVVSRIAYTTDGNAAVWVG
jgi:hypothetical protein